MKLWTPDLAIRRQELEYSLPPSAPDLLAIKTAFDELRPCHEAFMENVLTCVQMIGALTPFRLLRCREVSDRRRSALDRVLQCMEEWIKAKGRAQDTRFIELVTELAGHLRAYETRKVRFLAVLMKHLTGPAPGVGLVCPAELPLESDQTDIIAHMSCLQPCHALLETNLPIVLTGIGHGTPNWSGFHAPPNTVRWDELDSVCEGIRTWLIGGTTPVAEAGMVFRELGEMVPQKEWLALCLLSTVVTKCPFLEE